MIQQAAGVPFRSIPLLCSACETRRSRLRRTIATNCLSIRLGSVAPFCEQISNVGSAALNSHSRHPGNASIVMASCNAEANDMEDDERKHFMNDYLRKSR